MTSEREIPWQHVAPALRHLQAEAADAGLPLLVGLDQMQAYVRDRLDQLDLVVAEPEVVYTALCVLALMVECARNGCDNGIVTKEEAVGIASIVRSLAAVFAMYAPEEAKSC